MLVRGIQVRCHLYNQTVRAKNLFHPKRILSESAQASLNEAFYRKVPAEDQKRERGDFEEAEAASRR